MASATAVGFVNRPPNPQTFWNVSGFPLDDERPSMITQSYKNPIPVKRNLHGIARL